MMTCPHCGRHDDWNDWDHAPLPPYEVLIERQSNGRFLWRAKFFVSHGPHWGYQETGGFAASQDEAIAAVEAFEAEVSGN